MTHSTLRKTISAVTHPLFFLAACLLLLNDHVLRVIWPSWLTGKLGDVAWLFIAPLALLLVLTICLPRAGHVLLILSFGLVGGLYVLGNVWPGFPAWAGNLFHLAVGRPAGMVSDPGDLLALPALAISFWHWRRCAAQARPVFTRKAWAVLGMMLTAVLTVANMAAPDYGVSGVDVRNGQIIACSAYLNYSSQDGGLAWHPADVNFSDGCGSEWDQTISITQNGGSFWLRFNPQQNSLERSDDNQIWRLEYSLQPVSQAGQALYIKESTGNVVPSQGIWDAVFDPASGNVIFALGLEGVLVRDSAGGWQMVQVGDFGPRQVRSLHDFSVLLGGEAALAVLLGLLMLATTGLKYSRRFGFLLLLGLGWLGWLVCSLFQPALYDNYPIPILMPLGASALLIAPAAVYSVSKWIRQPRRSLVVAMAVALDALFLFMGLFVVWALDIIPEYRFAMWAGYALVLLDAAILLLLIPSVRQKSPAEERSEI